jgi:hypothetical protein
VPLEAYYAANWAVTDWYLDGTTGSDSNDGTSAATPLKTGAELQRRVGTYAKWDHSVTIHVLANGINDPLILRGKLTTTNIHVDVIGTPTVLASDTLTSYLALNHATPRATEIVGTTIADFTPYVGQRVRITSGANEGWTSWIAKANPNGVGVATARVSPGVALNTTSSSLIFSNPVPVASDPFVVESLPPVKQVVIDLDGTYDTSATGALWLKRMYSIQSVDCYDITVRCSGAIGLYRSVIFGCKIALVSSWFAHSRDVQLMPILGCCVLPNYSTTSNELETPVYYSLFLCPGGLVLQNRPIMVTDSLCQGTSINVYCPENYLRSIQIFDVAATSGSLYVLSSAVVRDISGSGNVVGIRVQNGCILQYGGTLNLLGSTTDCQLGTAPAINLTLTQFKQPNDYAQKGTAKLVAGSVTVTVPWYSNTIQQVMVTDNTPGGTVGNWTVTQTSTTQFTITSSSALDTSTVNWFITPLGRSVSVVAYA